MNKSGFFVFFLVFLLLYPSIFCFSVAGSNAGVGVLNVAPKFAYMQIEQRSDDTIRVYLNISDYNSWGDIYRVDLILLDKKTEDTVAWFSYKQYESKETWDKIHLFEQTMGEDLLSEEKCSVTYSDKKITVEQRCEMSILFVFNSTYFSQLKVVISDREGGNKATALIDYNPTSAPEIPSEEKRQGNLLFIPWFDDNILVNIPSNFPTLFALLIGLLGAMICIKKSRRSISSKRTYDQG